MGLSQVVAEDRRDLWKVLKLSSSLLGIFCFTLSFREPDVDTGGKHDEFMQSSREIKVSQFVFIATCESFPESAARASLIQKSLETKV